ncbi:MAG: Ig-like domain-containing protein [Gammaproteobacteria bacterium]
MYLNVSARLTRFLTVAGMAAILAGCGQGSGPQPVAGTPQTPQAGVLLDSPVSGVSWTSTSGESGTTNDAGEFDYLPFDQITFSIGGIELGTVDGAPFVTVVELTDSDNPNTREAVNMLVFLQSIDSDGDPSNGITISSTGISQAAGLQLDFGSDTFADEIGAVVTAIGGPNAIVVSEADALQHFYDTYAAMGGTGALSFPFPGFPPVGPGADIYQLKFADEFDEGDVPSAENWTIETGYGPNNDGWGNNEWQEYTTSPDNVRVEDGNLVLEARCDTPPCGSRDGSITSGKINTLNKFNFKYGKVVARIKPPVGPGSWPAFWALGANFPDIGWPRSGEIDFMEMFSTGSNDRTTHSTLHWCDETIQAPAECSFPEGRVLFGQSRSFLNSLGDDFQVWEADWSEERITVAINGVSYFSRTIDVPTMDEFLKEFYMILNVAMGGTLGSNNQPPSGAEVWPQTMLVDYVRVYQSTGSTSSEVQIIDFEEAAENYDYGESAGFGGGAAGVIPNPQIDDANPSAQVSVMRKFAGEVFGGSSLFLPEPIIVSAGSTFTIKVWSPREVPVTFKLEGDSPIERLATHTGSGWEELTFDFGSYSGVAEALTLIFDLGVVGDAEGAPDDWTFYFDDITYTPSTDGNVPTGADDFPLDFEDSPETYNFGPEGGFGGGAVSVLPNPVAGDINVSAQVARMLKFDGEVFAGSLLTLPATLDVAENSRFTMKVWSPRPVMVLLKLEGETDIEIDVQHTGSGWEELTYDYGSYSSTINGLSFIFDLGIVGDAMGDPENWTFYFDDITYLSGDDIIVPPADTTAPMLTNVSVSSNNANSAFAAVGNVVTVSVTANEAILAPVVTIAGAAATQTTGAGTQWQATRTLTANDTEGPVTFSVAYSDVADNAGQVVAAVTDTSSVVFDASAPALAIEGLAAALTALDPTVLTFQFDEDVSGFDVSDIMVTNGAASGFASTDDATYTATITPSADGELAVSVSAGAAQDAAGNMSTAASVNALVDQVAPAVVVQGVPADFATLDPVSITVQFSEMVTGFDAGDIQATNGAVSNFVAVSVTTYTADITPDGAGDLTVSVAAGVAQDNAGNFNTPATATALIDAVVPTVTIEGVPTDFDTLDAISLTFQFSETVTTFDVTDVDVTNGAASNFVAVDADTYTADVVPDGVGDLTVAIAAGAAQDGVGNVNEAATATALIDAVAPTLSIDGVPTDFATLVLVPVTFQFSEAVTGFTVEDIQVTNGSASAFVAVDEDTYTADITPDGAGDLTVSVAADAAQDGVGNASVVAVDAVSLIDAVVPTVVVSGAPADFTALAPFTITIQFSEAVMDFVIGDIQVTNGAAGSFTAVDDSTYTADITPNGNGDLTIDVAAGAAQDGVGNDSTAAASVTVLNNLDTEAPLFTVISIASDNATSSSFATTGDVVTVTMTANEDIIEPVVLINGVAADDVTGAGASWSATRIMPAADTEGLISITLNLEDLDGNVGPESTVTTDSTSVTFDVTAPTLSINGLPGTFEMLDPLDVTFQFSEDVTGFDASDITVENGAASMFVAVDASTYTAQATPDGTGNMTVSVAASAAQDLAGLQSVMPTDAVVSNDVDVQAPTLTLVSIVSDNAVTTAATTGDSVTITMTSDEDIVAPTVTIAGSAATVTGSGSSWQATRALLVTDTDGAIGFTIDFEDLVGNAGTQVTTPTDATSVTLDSEAPTLAITGLAATFTSLDPIALTFTFSEDVSGFEVGDIAVTNGAVDAVVETDAATYTANVTPDGMGDLTVSVAADAAADTAGNTSEAATESSTADLPPSWELVWSDDFDGPTLDAANWTARTDADCPAPCDGVQTYDAANVTIAGGVLTIAAQENVGPAYVSGLIDSRGKREYKYGRVEIDARMPGTLGAAPALMMLPTSDAYGTWPLSGEIDIVKAPDLGVGGNAEVEQALVYGLPTPENTETSGTFTATTPDAAFITYAIEWEEGEIRWFVGDTHVLTQTQDNWYAYPEDDDGVFGVADGAAPFDEDFYLALSLAVDGSADGTSVFPQSLEIDAVRVYECANATDPAAGTGCSTGDAGVTPVVATDEPFVDSLDVYVDGLETVDFIDEAMATTMSTLVTVTETSDVSVVVAGDLAAIDPEGGTIWNLDITAATGVADILVQPDTFADMNGSFNLTGGGTAGEILFRMRVNSAMGTPTLTVGMEDNASGSGSSALAYEADGQWKQFSVKISDVVTDSVMNATTLDLAAITNLFKLSATGGSINLDIDDIEVKVACRDTDGCEVTPTLTELPAVVRYSTDFESANPDPTMNTRIGSGWRYFNAVYLGNPSEFEFSYFGLAPNGPQISALVTDQGGVEQGGVQLTVYSDYECCQNPATGHQANTEFDIVEVNVFREDNVDAVDVGKTLTFSFDVKKGNIELDSTAFAFIKVLDPNDGFSETGKTEIELTNTSADWIRVDLELVIGDWTDQTLQFGFQTFSSRFQGAGNFYDNIEVTETTP